jgi:D-threo-aldose 1-dehydrogenase
MELGKTMAETVAPHMPSAAEIAACRWLTEAELGVYSSEYARTGFQGGLNWYRVRTSGKFDSEIEVFSGRTIDVPSCFISARATGASTSARRGGEDAGERLHAHAGLPPRGGSRALGAAGAAGGREPPVARVSGGSTLMTDTPVALRQLGKTAVKTSALGLGGAPIGGFRFALSDEQGAETVRAGYAAGLRYFDTSPLYGYGRSELLYGFALRSQPRDSFVLSTKVGRWMTPLREGEAVDGWRSGGLPFKATFDYSRDGTLRSLEQSLLRLGMARIDVALIHDVDVWTHGSQAEADRRFKETMAGCYPALVELRRAGVIRAIGVGLNETRWGRALPAKPTSIASCSRTATRCSSRARSMSCCRCARRRACRSCSRRRSTPASSRSARARARPTTTSPRRRLFSKRCAASRRCAAATTSSWRPAALQFPLAHPRLASIVAGAIKSSEVRENVARMSAPIPRDLWQELKHEKLLAEAAPGAGLSRRSCRLAVTLANNCARLLMPTRSVRSCSRCACRGAYPNRGRTQGRTGNGGGFSRRVVAASRSQP